MALFWPSPAAVSMHRHDISVIRQGDSAGTVGCRDKNPVTLIGTELPCVVLVQYLHPINYRILPEGSEDV